jgi:hypothetical protein
MWRLFLFFLCISLTQINASAAQEGASAPLPLTVSAQYHFSFAGVVFGKAAVEVAQGANRFAMTTDIMTTGLVNTFTRHSSHTTLTGTGALDAATSRYEADYQTKKKQKYVRIARKGGKVVEEEVRPPENRDKRPAVSQHMKDQAYDPLSIVLALRQRLQAALARQQPRFDLLLFDGRRLSRLHFVVIGQAVTSVGGVKTPVWQVDVSRTVLEGYTASELADAKGKEPPLHIYFTQDERLLPVVFEAKLLLGTVRAALVKECATAAECAL